MAKFFRLIPAIFFGLASFVRKNNMRAFFCCLVLALLARPTFAQHPLNGQTPDELYRQGIDLLEHHQYGAARDLFTRFSTLAKNDPRKAEADYHAAFCAVSLYHADGEKEMETFIQNNPGHPRAASAYFELASFFYLQKNYNKTIEYYSRTEFRTLSAEQQNIGRFRWGYSLFNQKKLNPALDQFNFIKAQGGTYGPASSYYAGFIEFSNKDYPNALIDLKRAEQNAAYATVVPNVIMQTLYRQGNLDACLAYYHSVKEREGVAQAEEMALLASEVLFKKGDFENAVKGYEQFLEGNTTADPAIFYRAGYASLKSGKDELAITYLKRAALAKDSVSGYASYQLGSLYLKTNQKPLALAAFELTRDFPQNKNLSEESSFQYAKLSYDLGRSDDAINELERFMNAYPTSDRITEVKEVLSHAYINANNYNKAIEYIESLTRRGPSLDRAYQKATFLKGIELYNMERYAESIGYFEKSLQFPLDPALAGEAHFWAGEAYSFGKKYEQAIEHYSSAISPTAGTVPEIVVRSRYGIGYAYFNTKQYDRATFSFKEFVTKARDSDSNLPDAMLRLADCYYVSKAYNDALTTYRKVTQGTSPDKDYAHLQSGIILGIQRKYGEAANELNRVVSSYPQSGYREEALFQIAQLNFEQGRYLEAANGYGRVIESNSSSRFVPYALMRRAAAYFNLKDFDKTCTDYITVVNTYPAHPVAKEVLVPLQEALGLANRSDEFAGYLAKFKGANPDATGIESVEFETASNLFFNQQYAKAITSFSTYVQGYPESPRLVDAQYYLAESHYRLKDFDKAIEGFSSIQNESTFSMLPKVLARMAELEFRKGGFEKAIVQYQRLQQVATNKKDQYTAWSGLMESHYLLAQYDSADHYARIILEKGNINAGAVNKASLYLGKTAMGRGNYEAAKDEFLNTLNAAKDEYGAEAKYLLGEIFYLTKDKACYETLVALISDFAPYKEWVGKAYLLLSDYYLSIGDRFQAKATLKSIIDNDFPVAHIKSSATEKLAKLEGELKREQSDVKKDTTDNRP